MNAYRDFEDLNGFARVVDVVEVRVKGNNLSIPLYIRMNNVNQVTGVAEPASLYGLKPLTQAIEEWQKSSQELHESLNELFEILEGNYRG